MIYCIITYTSILSNSPVVPLLELVHESLSTLPISRQWWGLLHSGHLPIDTEYDLMRLILQSVEAPHPDQGNLATL